MSNQHIIVMHNDFVMCIHQLENMVEVFRRVLTIKLSILTLCL